jgi:hypothetical protein
MPLFKKAERKPVEEIDYPLNRKERRIKIPGIPLAVRFNPVLMHNIHAIESMAFWSAFDREPMAGNAGKNRVEIHAFVDRRNGKIIGFGKAQVRDKSRYWKMPIVVNTRRMDFGKLPVYESVAREKLLADLTVPRKQLDGIIRVVKLLNDAREGAR